MLLMALLVGACLPQLAGAAGLVRWLVMIMFLLCCCGLPLRRSWRDSLPLQVVAAAQVLAWGIWLLLRPIDADWALAGFLIAATPTATAAPAVMLLLGQAVERVAASVLIGNLLTVLLLTVELPLLGLQPQVLELAVPVGLTVLPPVVVAVVLRRWWPGVAGFLAARRGWAFHCWLVALALIAARSSAQIADGTLPVEALLPAMLLAAPVCLLCFAGGRLLAGVEGAQALGQKNTVLTVWLAMQWCSPAVALVPVCYAIAHNCVNAWQLQRAQGLRAASSAT